MSAGPPLSSIGTRSAAPAAIDWESIRNGLRDTRMWILKGEVLEFEDDTGTDDEEQILDVRVRLLPTGIEIWAEWSGSYIGPGFGDWHEPAVGDHVIVGLSPKHDGDNEEAVILGGLWSKNHKKPNVSATGKRLIIVRPGDDLEIRATDGGGFLLDVDGNGNVVINCQRAINLVSESDSKFEVTGGNTLNLQGLKVAVHNGGARFAVVLVKELNTMITAFNAAVTIFNAHVHPGVTVGVASTGSTITPQATTSSASGSPVLEAEE